MWPKMHQKTCLEPLSKLFLTISFFLSKILLVCRYILLLLTVKDMRPKTHCLMCFGSLVFISFSLYSHLFTVK